MISAFEKHEIDAVIHLAGLKSVGESVFNPIPYYQNKVCGTLSLIEAMQATNIKTLVFSSSTTVYGAPKYLPCDEDHPTNPSNPYGNTKLQAEKILSDLVQSDNGWSIAILRYFNPSCAHESGLIGESPVGVPNNLMPYISQVAAGMLPQLKIFGKDYETKDGTGERDYIHVMDLAEAHLAALDFTRNHRGMEIFNIGAGNAFSVLEMIQAFERATKVAIPVEFVRRRYGDLPEVFASVEKACSILSWSANRSLDDMCVSGWRCQQNIALAK